MRVLVVDDEENVRKGLATFLELSGHEALAVANLASAREALTGETAFGAALVDVYIGTENGSSLLDFASERELGASLIMMSGKGSVRDAVAALHRGAYDFLEKPIDTDRLLAILRNLERESAVARRLGAFTSSWLAEHAYIERGSSLEAAFETARKSAASPLSVLVTGPTGSGKELVARWIHLCSPRSQGPFVAVNCAAIPPDLAESAFFGSRKGSYTGSVADRSGYFEAASGGSLFLDEVGELPLPLQAALLRAVELGEIQGVGDTSAKRVDVRIVAATNRDLRAEISAGRFREDLYWRLAQTTVELPSLDSRKSEIRGLAAFLAFPIREQMGDKAPSLGEDALAYLESRSWPGNVRELGAFLERALWLAPSRSLIDASFLARLGQASGGDRPASLNAPNASLGLRASGASPNASSEAAPAATGPAADGGSSLSSLKALLGLPEIASLAEAKEAFERSYVSAVLEGNSGSVARAAEELGLLPNNLSRKLKDLGLR
jgi:DNA-binding NtrC family response regulator